MIQAIEKVMNVQTKSPTGACGSLSPTMTAVTCNAAQPAIAWRRSGRSPNQAEMPSATRNIGRPLLTNPPSKKDETTITAAEASGAAIGNRRRKNSGPTKAIVIRTSSQAGPSAPFGSGARTEIESMPAIAARISASTQKRRTSEERRVTRPGASREVGSRPRPAGRPRARRRRPRPARACRPGRGRRSRRRRPRSRRR